MALDPQVLDWTYALLLLVLGFALVLLEIFVIPGFNIFGILGLGTVLVGVWYAHAALGPGAAVGVALLGLAGTFVLVRLLVRHRAWRRLVLHSETSREQGFDSAPPGLGALVGQVGRTVSPLRPGGRALFGEQTVDVVTQGGFVEAGAAVEVLSVAGNRVVVQQR